jgi:hypothetical protein
LGEMGGSGGEFISAEHWKWLAVAGIRCRPNARLRQVYPANAGKIP